MNRTTLVNTAPLDTFHKTSLDHSTSNQTEKKQTNWVTHLPTPIRQIAQLVIDIISEIFTSKHTSAKLPSPHSSLKVAAVQPSLQIPVSITPQTQKVTEASKPLQPHVSSQTTPYPYADQNVPNMDDTVAAQTSSVEIPLNKEIVINLPSKGSEQLWVPALNKYVLIGNPNDCSTELPLKIVVSADRRIEAIQIFHMLFENEKNTIQIANLGELSLFFQFVSNTDEDRHLEAQSRLDWSFLLGQKIDNFDHPISISVPTSLPTDVQIKPPYGALLQKFNQEYLDVEKGLWTLGSLAKKVASSKKWEFKLPEDLNTPLTAEALRGYLYGLGDNEFAEILKDLGRSTEKGEHTHKNIQANIEQFVLKHKEGNETCQKIWVLIQHLQKLPDNKQADIRRMLTWAFNWCFDALFKQSKQLWELHKPTSLSTVSSAPKPSAEEAMWGPFMEKATTAFFYRFVEQVAESNYLLHETTHVASHIYKALKQQNQINLPDALALHDNPKEQYFSFDLKFDFLGTKALKQLMKDFEEKGGSKNLSRDFQRKKHLDLLKRSLYRDEENTNAIRQIIDDHSIGFQIEDLWRFVEFLKTEDKQKEVDKISSETITTLFSQHLVRYLPYALFADISSSYHTPSEGSVDRMVAFSNEDDHYDGEDVKKTIEELGLPYPKGKKYDYSSFFAPTYAATVRVLEEAGIILT